MPICSVLGSTHAIAPGVAVWVEIVLMRFDIGFAFVLREENLVPYERRLQAVITTADGIERIEPVVDEIRHRFGVLLVGGLFQLEQGIDEFRIFAGSFFCVK